MEPLISLDQTAQAVIQDLATASETQARAALEEEQEGRQRVTVARAAQARLEELAIPGEPQASTPSGTWGRLMDPDGKPVLVDGQEVAVPLTP